MAYYADYNTHMPLDRGMYDSEEEKRKRETQPEPILPQNNRKRNPGDWIDQTNFVTYTNDYTKPFNVDYLDNNYVTAVKTLNTANKKKTRTAAEIMRDAFLLTDQMADFSIESAAVQNYNLKNSDVYLKAAQKNFEQMLQRKSAEYEAAGMTSDEQLGWLTENGYEGRGQGLREDESRYQAWLETQQEKEPEIKTENPWILQLQGMNEQEQQKNLQALEDAGELWYTVKTEGAYALSPEQMGVLQALTEGKTDDELKALNPWDVQDLADQWMQEYQDILDSTETVERSPEYDWLQEMHDIDDKSRLEEFAALEKAGPLWERMLQGKTQHFTDAEIDALNDLFPELSPEEKEAITPEQAQARANEKLQAGRAIWQWNETAMTPYMEEMLKIWRQTPAGAEAWVEDAAGTEDEQKAKDNLWFVQKENQFAGIPDSPDYAVYSKYEAPEDFSSEDDRFYGLVNGDPKAMEAEAYSQQEGRPYTPGIEYSNLTKEEKGIFNYLWQNNRKDEAREYLEYKSYESNKRWAEQAAQEARNLSEKGPLGATVGSLSSVALSPLRSAGYLDVLWQKAQNALTGNEKPIDPNRQANQIGGIQDAYREAVMENYDWMVNILGKDVDLFDFIYGTGMSGMDSMLAGAVGGGPAAGAILGLGAAQNAMQDVYDRDGNDRQAMLAGLFNGIFEGLFESISIGKFYDEARMLGHDDFASRIWNVIAQTGINASEEFNTAVADMVFDTLLMGDKSEFEQKKKYYYEHGLTGDGEADARALWDFCMQAMEEGAGGALMGSWFGTLSSATSAINTRKADAQTGSSIINQDSQQLLKDIAMTLPEGSEARNLAEKYAAGKANARQTGKLYRAVYGMIKGSPWMQETLKDRMTENVAQRLLQSTEQDAGAAAEAIVNLYSGEDITPEQAQAIAQNQEAMGVLGELMGVNEEEAQQTPAEPQAAQQTEQQTAQEQQEETAAEEGTKPARPIEQGLNSLYGTEEQAQATQQEAHPAAEETQQAQQTEETTAQAPVTENTEEAQQEETQPAAEEPQGPQAPILKTQTQKEDGTTRETKVQRVQQNEDGETTATLEDGTQESVDDLDVDEDRKELLNRAGRMDQDAGRDMINHYQDGQDAAAYAIGFNRIMTAARQGKTLAEIHSLYGKTELTEAQQQAAYEAGRREAARMEAEKAKINRRYAKQEGYGTLEDAGEKGTGVLFANVTKKLTDSAKRQLAIIDAFAKKYGLQVHVYDTLQNENASYLTGSNIINVGLDADDGALTRAVSHEGFHYIKNWDPEAAQQLQALVMDTLGNTEGYDLDERIRKMREQYKKNGQNLSEDAAQEEIAAESMLDVIGSKETVQQLMKENPGLAAKIRDWLAQVMQDLRGILQKYTKYSPEGKAILKQIDQLQTWHDAYRQALETAQENYIAAQEGATTSAKEDTAVTDYMQDMKAGTDAQEALNGLVSQLFFQTQGNWIQEHMDADMDEALKRFSDALMNYRKNETALSVELEKAGFAAPEDMSALSYAADQLMGREERTGETPEIKSNLKQNRYDYQTLIQSKPMEITQINEVDESEVNRLNAISTNAFAGEELENLKKENKGSPVVNNTYTKTGIIVTKQSFTHSIRRALTKGYIQVSNHLKSILENAIPVNELKGRVKEGKENEIVQKTNHATVYIGLGENTDQYSAVRFIVNNYTHDLEDYDVLYSITKSDIEKRGTVIKTRALSAKPGSTNSSVITIADLLDLVKGVKNIAAVLSKDTTKALGIDRPEIKGLSEGLKYNLKRTAQEADNSQESKDLQDKAIQIFGKTYNWMTTGYLLPNGDRLDFSGKREGSSGKYREEDHRAIQEAYGENTDLSGNEAMIDFMRRGAIRIMPESGGIQMQTIPTKEQLQALDSFISKMRGEVIIDIDDDQGNTIFSKEYAHGTFSRTIINDIPTLFEEAGRSQSDTARFHSERYNLKREDVAGDVEDDAALYAQVESDRDAREALELLQRLDESAREEAKGAWEKRLSEIGNKIIGETGSKISKQKLNGMLRNLYEAMEDGDISLGEKVMYARQAVKEAMKTGGSLREADETMQEALRLIKTRGFYLTDDMKSEIRETYGSVRAYMQKNFGKMAIRARGTRTSKGSYASLLDLWSDLNELMPGTFDMNATEADMPAMLDAFVEQAGQRQYDAYYGADGEAFATDLAYRTMLEYYDVPTALKRTQEIRQEFRQRLEDYRTSYKQKQEEKARVSKERAEATARKEKLRGEISRDVKYLNTRTVAPTDSRHVPEELREAVMATILPFTERTGVWSAEKAAQLRREYQLIGRSDQSIKWLYDEETADRIERLEKTLAGRTLSQLTEAELADLRDIVGNLKKMVDQGNEMLVAGQRSTLEKEGEQFIQEMQQKNTPKNKWLRKLQGLTYQNMTPAYYADQVGGIVKEKIGELYQGQNQWAFIMKAAKEKAEEIAKRYRLNDWINGEHLRFTTQRGETLELSKGEALALYATWKRETTNRRQNANHLRVGGFTYAPNTEYEGVDTRSPHAVTAADMQQVMDYLGAEQMAYADEMVNYLSKDMAALGNETSIQLYGYNKFGESYYFPYSSDRRFTYAEFGEQKDAGSKQIKNAGMTKATVKNASNPVALGDFLDVWAGHVNQMALYNAFAVTSTDLNRLLNFNTAGLIMVDSGTGREDLVAAKSLRLSMENALGKEAVQYLQTLLTDVNGGVRADERTAAGKMISLFKKGSVAANASVTLQQPSAIMRAMYMISPKYFLKMNPAKIAQNIQEMSTYSGVAIIKDMGRFDTGTGKSATQWLNDYVQEENLGKRIYDKMDWLSGIAPEWADRVTWAALWNATKNEVAANVPGIESDTEAYMQAVAERFNDVVNHTQVYDSTLSKSSLMRSQSLFDKIATSFMAEPTVSFNMLLQGMQQLNTPGGKARAGRAVGAFVAATVLNAILKSFATMGRRKDDDERTVIEKYLGEVVENAGEDLSPQGIISLVPLARDVVSIFQGYDVSRADMDVVEQLYSAVKVVENENKTAWEKIQAVAGAVGSATGVPMKNVLRDIGGIFNVLRSAPVSETSGRDVKYTVLDSLPSILGIQLWDSAKKAYYERIESAMTRGDDRAVEEMTGYLQETEKVKETTLETGIKNVMKESVKKGILTQDRATELLVKYLGKDADKAYFETEKWLQETEHEGEEEYSYSQYREVTDLAREGKDITAAMKKLTDHGKDEKDVRGAVKTGIGEWYKAGEITADEAKRKLKQYVPTLNDNDIFWTLEEWEWGKTHGEKEKYSRYNELKTGIEKNNGSAISAAAKKLTDHGVKKETVGSQITSMFKQRYTDLYKAGKSVEAANLKATLLTAYAALGYDRDKKNKDIDKWVK